MNRFTLIDGLRGVASMMVAAGHLYGAIAPAVGNLYAQHIGKFLDLGRFGVEIFFVISGFVIAYSIRDGSFTSRYFGKFVLRRFVRLDPSYWSIIIIEIALIHISLRFFPSLHTHIPTLKQIAAHLVYSQDLLGLGNILPIFWTLCYEVQFYIVLVGSFVILNALKAATPCKHSINIVFVAIAIVSYSYSIGTYLHILPKSMNGLFIDRWFQFLLGAIAFWSSSNRTPKWLFPITGILSFLLILYSNANEYRMVSSYVVLTISLIIYIGSITNNLSNWLNSRVLLFFGSISYALYLVHLPIGWRFIALMRKILGNHISLIDSLLIFFAGMIVSIFAASVFYIVIEKPSLRLAQRIKLPKTTGIAGNLNSNPI